MLSEGRPGLDNVYSLKEGTITKSRVKLGYD
jgi:hypothetical protein